MRIKGVDRMANSVALGQTGLKKQFELAQHCLLKPSCPILYGTLFTSHQRDLEDMGMWRLISAREIDKTVLS